jgi:hypothetical protein
MPRKEPMRPQPGGHHQPIAPWRKYPREESNEAVIPEIGPANDGSNPPTLKAKRTGYSNTVGLEDNYKPPVKGTSLQAQQKA